MTTTGSTARSNNFANIRLSESDFLRAVPYITIKQQIGKGGFGDVWEGIFEKEVQSLPSNDVSNASLSANANHENENMEDTTQKPIVNSNSGLEGDPGLSGDVSPSAMVQSTSYSGDADNSVTVPAAACSPYVPADNSSQESSSQSTTSSTAPQTQLEIQNLTSNTTVHTTITDISRIEPINGVQGESVAVKRIAFPTGNPESVHKRLMYLHRELTLLKILKTYANKEQDDYMRHADIYNDLIMDLKNTYIIQNVHRESCFIFQVTELFHSDLRESKWKILGECRPADLKYIIYKSILGLEFIHHLGIVHRDISPDNIFLNWQEGNTRPTKIVISDFGQARFYLEYKGSTVPETYARKHTNRRRASLTHPHLLGKIHFRPPEGLAYFTTSYYEQSWDIWQIGVVFLNMISKTKHPFVQEEQDYQMLLRPAQAQEGTISNDTYMLGLIEKHMGYPSEIEMRDLVFFYPKEQNHENMLERRQLSTSQMTQHQYKQTYYNDLLSAFQKSFKAKGFRESRHKEGPELDQHRLNDLTAGNRRKNFITGDIGNETLSFLITMLRYSPKNRPSTRCLLNSDYFNDKSYTIPINELPKQQVLYQEQLTNMQNKGFDKLKKFTSDYITKWGYIKLVRFTRHFQQVIIVELFKIIWTMADEWHAQQPDSPKFEDAHSIQEGLNERVADMQMRSHVYINNPNFQLSISGEAYVVFHVDTFIIIVEDVAMTNGFF